MLRSFIEHNFLAGRTFADVADLNAQARAFGDRVNATPKRHLHAGPWELFAAERAHLRPLPHFVPEVYVEILAWQPHYHRTCQRGHAEGQNQPTAAASQA